MKSNISGAGYGLFSTSDYREKHLMTLMYGMLKSFTEASKECDATFHYTPFPRPLVQAMEGPALQTMVENLQTLVSNTFRCSGVLCTFLVW